MSERSVSEAISEIYRAATEPGRWVVVLDRIAAINDHPSFTHLAHWNHSTGALGFSHMVGLDPGAHVDYAAWAGKIDPRAQTLEKLSPGASFRCDDIFDDDFVRHSEFYNDYVYRYDSDRGFFAKLASGQDSSVGLAVVKRYGAGGVTDAVVDLLGTLMPHITQAVQLSRHLSELRLENALLEEELFASGKGFALVDGHARIAKMSLGFERLVARGDGLKLADGILQAQLPTQTDLLLKAIADCTKAASGIIAPAGLTFFVARLSGKLPFRCRVMPLPPETRLGPMDRRKPMSLVIVSDPDRRGMPTASDLRLVFGLTRAESLVAAQAGLGHSIEDIADGCAISVPTARTHLKAIFTKTATHSRPELVALLQRLTE